MRRLTAWIGGTAAGIAAYRLLRRRQQMAPEPAPEPVAEEEPESPDERRQRVHEEGRAALDEMRPDDSG